MYKCMLQLTWAPSPVYFSSLVLLCFYVINCRVESFSRWVLLWFQDLRRIVLSCEMNVFIHTLNRNVSHTWNSAVTVKLSPLSFVSVLHTEEDKAHFPFRIVMFISIFFKPSFIWGSSSFDLRSMRIIIWPRDTENSGWSFWVFLSYPRTPCAFTWWDLAA